MNNSLPNIDTLSKLEQLKVSKWGEVVHITSVQLFNVSIPYNEMGKEISRLSKNNPLFSSMVSISTIIPLHK